MKNKKIILIGAGILIVIALIFVGISAKKAADYRNPQTLEELREAKPNSEYVKCLEEVEANNQKEVDCIQNKLKAKGYTDGVDCIQDFEDPICDSNTDKGYDRYNAQVDASNECMDSNSAALNEFDCIKLIGK